MLLIYHERNFRTWTKIKEKTILLVQYHLLSNKTILQVVNSQIAKWIAQTSTTTMISLVQQVAGALKAPSEPDSFNGGNLGTS